MNENTQEVVIERLDTMAGKGYRLDKSEYISAYCGLSFQELPQENSHYETDGRETVGYDSADPRESSYYCPLRDRRTATYSSGRTPQYQQYRDEMMKSDTVKPSAPNLYSPPKPKHSTKTDTIIPAHCKSCRDLYKPGRLSH